MARDQDAKAALKAVKDAKVAKATTYAEADKRAKAARKIYDARKKGK